MGSVDKRLERLEGSFEPPEDDTKAQRRKQIREVLNELGSLLSREGGAIEDRMALLQEQGHSYQDAMTIAKDEIVRARNAQLADYLDAPYPPEIRHDPVAKRRWLTNYIESRRERNFARRIREAGA